LPSAIFLEVPHIPETIQIIGPMISIPSEIKIIGAETIPNEIQLISQLPSVIFIECEKIPRSIRLEIPEHLPSMILDISRMPTSIQVVGMPSVIEIIGNIPSEIMLRAPEDIEIPLVYKGGPVPLRLEYETPTGKDGEDLPCFSLVPCGRK